MLVHSAGAPGMPKTGDTIMERSIDRSSSGRQYNIERGKQCVHVWIDGYDKVYNANVYNKPSLFWTFFV